ncbi:MAG: divergent PAP2 family protein [Prolixibacteraceae bacterium]
MDNGIILNNKILDVVILSMFTAQFYKLVSTLIIQRKFVWSRLWETGGMPSAHTASVAALSTAIAITQGIESYAFAISAVFAVIVMHDAAGIRKAAGEHAGMINQLNDFFTNVFDKKFKTEKLKTLLGHSKSEVFAGAVLGIIVGFILKKYLLS